MFDVFIPLNEVVLVNKNESHMPRSSLSALLRILHDPATLVPVCVEAWCLNEPRGEVVGSDGALRWCYFNVSELRNSLGVFEMKLSTAFYSFCK